MDCRNEFFIIRIPDTGSIHEAVRIIADAGITVTRCHFNRSIDPKTAFVSVRGSSDGCHRAMQALSEQGYLQSEIRYPKSIRFTVIVPDIPGTLHRILMILDNYKAEITSLAFDNRGKNPDRLSIAVRVRDTSQTEELLDAIRAHYQLEIDGYDCGDDESDGCLFYQRYAERVRAILGETADPYLVDLLNQFSHIAQQLTEYGEEYETTLEQILQNGRRLAETSGDGFFADVQKIPITNGIWLYCFQLPGGGSIFVIDTPTGRIMVDTGYGIYHNDVMQMFRYYGLDGAPGFTRIILTHGDTDHCGAAGYFEAPVWTHEGTWNVIKTNNRAYGACSEDLVFEQVYTVMINLFARMHPPVQVNLFPPPSGEKVGAFPLLCRFEENGISGEIIEGYGGHQHGMVYLLCRELGLLFTSDTILNLKHLTPDRSQYNGFAVYLVRSVNVNPDLVRNERKDLMNVATDLDAGLQKKGNRLIICCGHGPVSTLENGDLIPLGTIESYRHIT
ncbi:MAG: MBL fold metallo-hydrolase [Methanospirillum sp.]|uniref:MBL fold metallo-hydrolase n=1 Tax=Methanospirillum sp. TaxID=45200 RepID=UPI002369EF56|nr:MBL fold metallo-hydrolase [Methanospirillum sp.]MDD1730384.1 MBL fold metallo-hydrolase [Methanospirillum sp.]